MDFKGKKSIDEIVKIAQVEVLLSDIKVDHTGTNVRPAKCPAIGRKNDYLKDMGSQPTCVMGHEKCQYFELAIFDLEDYTKKIICNAISLEEIKER